MNGMQKNPDRFKSVGEIFLRKDYIVPCKFISADLRQGSVIKKIRYNIETSVFQFYPTGVAHIGFGASVVGNGEYADAMSFAGGCKQGTVGQ